MIGECHRLQQEVVMTTLSFYPDTCMEGLRKTTCLLAGTRWKCVPLDGTAFHLVPASKQSANLYDIYLTMYVQSRTPDDGRKDRPKQVEWYTINLKKYAFSWFYYITLDLYSGRAGFQSWTEHCLEKREVNRHFPQSPQTNTERTSIRSRPMSFKLFQINHQSPNH
jgi:hypothetical protein